jgi:hypothetical protein
MLVDEADMLGVAAVGIMRLSQAMMAKPVSRVLIYLLRR